MKGLKAAPCGAAFLRIFKSKKLELMSTKGYQTYTIYEKQWKAASYGVVFLQTFKSKKLELTLIGGYRNVPLWLRVALPVTIKTASLFIDMNLQRKQVYDMYKLRKTIQTTSQSRLTTAVKEG